MSMGFLLNRFRQQGTQAENADVGERLDRLINRTLRALTTLGYSGFVLWVIGFDKIIENYKVYLLPEFDVRAQLDNLSSYLLHNWPVLSLGIAVMIWFSRYKDALLNEIRILRSLFVPGQVPQKWRTLQGAAWIRLAAVFFALTFILLGATLNHIVAFSLVVLSLNILDFNGNRLIQTNLRTYLSDRRLVPGSNVSTGIRTAVRDLRHAAKEYWLKRPQTERVLLCFVGNAVVLVLAVKAEGAGIWRDGAYMVATAVILINEFVMWRWRIRRDALVTPARHQLEVEKERAVLSSGTRHV